MFNWKLNEKTLVIGRFFLNKNFRGRKSFIVEIRNYLEGYGKKKGAPKFTGTIDKENKV